MVLEEEIGAVVGSGEAYLKPIDTKDTKALVVVISHNIPQNFWSVQSCVRKYLLPYAKNPIPNYYF